MGVIDNTKLNIFWFAPNFGGAWFTTALVKQFFKPCGTTKPFLPLGFSIKIYMLVCFAVIVLAVLNELVYPLNTSGAFDPIDVIATIIAQIIAFIVPITIKDNCLTNYTK
jgi:hypothetical protein